MVAYSFKRQFVEPIRTGTKAQTIRADRARHARAGEALQLYCGMRTKGCFLIARATCLSVMPIRLDFRGQRVHLAGRLILKRADLDEFARTDGFADWEGFNAFWFAEHAAPDAWSGQVIQWKDLQVP